MRLLEIRARQKEAISSVAQSRLNKICRGLEYTPEEFLGTVFADGLDEAFWIEQVSAPIKPTKSYSGFGDDEPFTREDRLVASTLAGKLRVRDDDGVWYNPTWESFVNSLALLSNKEVNDLVNGDYDAYTMDSVLQYWILGDIIYG